MSSNELLEANVAAIRADVTELKADVRAIAAKADSEIKTAVGRMDEQFREVRQDIRALRAANETLRDRIDASHASLDKKIDATREALDKEIKATRETLDKKIDATGEALDKKIDTKTDELRADMKEMRSDIQKMTAGISGLRGMQKAILWMLGSFIALVGTAGAGLTIAKTLNWI